MSAVGTAFPEVNPRIDYLQFGNQYLGKGGLFVGDLNALEEAATPYLNAGMPFGHIVRYAIKANRDEEITEALDDMGVHFDAASIGEASILLRRGIDPDKISLSAQVWESDEDAEKVAKEGVKMTATSRRMIPVLGEFGCRAIALRPNPPAGPGGHDKRTSVAGPCSGFGIWHEKIPEVLRIAEAAGVIIDRLHIHTGSGGDHTPDVWRGSIRQALELVEKFPDVTTLDIGGGYKIARMPNEKAADMPEIFKAFSEELIKFAEKTGRQIRIEMEPGTYLVGNAVKLMGRVLEIEDTPKFVFPRLNVGMNALIRPSHYGARHFMESLGFTGELGEDTKYVVIGPACESGDNLVPVESNPQEFEPRDLKEVRRGDYILIYGAGAYAAYMSPLQYCAIAEPTIVYARDGQSVNPPRPVLSSMINE